jgi:hypothetical protein
MVMMIRLFVLGMMLGGVPVMAQEKPGLTPPKAPGFAAPTDQGAPAVNDATESVSTVGTLPDPALKAFEPQRFVSKPGGFSIDYPADWFPVPHPVMTLQVRPNIDSLSVLRVQVNKLSKPTTAEAFGKAQAARFAKFWIIEQQEPATLAGLPAWKVSHVQQIEARLTRSIKLFTVTDKKSYMLDCQSSPGAFPELLPICEQAIASFSIEP